MTELHSSTLIVGAGPIGMEFATVWNRYGTEVTVVEMRPRTLPLEDEEISVEAQKQFKNEGIAIMTGAMVDTVRPTGNDNDIYRDADGVEFTVFSNGSAIRQGVSVIPGYLLSGDDLSGVIKRGVLNGEWIDGFEISGGHPEISEYAFFTTIAPIVRTDRTISYLTPEEIGETAKMIEEAGGGSKHPYR